MEVFDNEEKWGNFGGNINIYSDLEQSDINIILSEPDIHSLQFYEFKTPSNKTWGILESLYKKHPYIGLHIFWEGEINFDFLKYLPSVKKFAVSSLMTVDFSPIKDYLDLEELSLGETKSKAVKINFISDFKNLKGFYNDGMKNGLEVIANLTELETLTLRCVHLDDLKIIENQTKLVELSLLFGSYKNLDAISSLKQLKRLEISKTSQIANYNFLNHLNNLDSLCLEGISELESIPALNGLR
jgi:hypothetical protein